MKALSQIRAANALRSAHQTDMGIGQEGGDALSGFPILICNDGLLPALAAAVEKKSGGTRKQRGAFLVATAIAEHLSADGIGIVAAGEPDGLVDELAQAPDDSQLRRATDEAREFLVYLKRFVS